MGGNLEICPKGVGISDSFGEESEGMEVLFVGIETVEKVIVEKEINAGVSKESGEQRSLDLLLKGKGEFHVKRMPDSQMRRVGRTVEPGRTCDLSLCSTRSPMDLWKSGSDDEAPEGVPQER